MHKLTLKLNRKHNDCWTIKFQRQINLKIAIDIKTRTAAMHKGIKCLCNSIILNQLSSTDNNTNRTRQSILERHLHIRSKISMQYLYIRSIAQHTLGNKIVSHDLHGKNCLKYTQNNGK